MQNRFDEHWDGIVRNRQTPLCEKYYAKGLAKNEVQHILPKWVYEDFFKRLKGKGKHFLFNQVQAEAALEAVFNGSLNPRSIYSKIRDYGQLYVEAEAVYMNKMGFKESVGESVGVISEYFGEYRLERANNPRRQRQGHGNKGSEAPYCLRVYRGGRPFGWIITLMGTNGKPIGYSFHYDDPHRDGFKFYAFTWGSMKKTLDALKNEFLDESVGESVGVAEAAAPTHGYKVGDILFGSTYYGMIIPHFYKVTRLIGATKIEVVELTLQQNGDGWSGQATPSSTPKSAAKIFTVKRSGSIDPGIKISNYLTAKKWDGRPEMYNYLD